MPIYANGRDTSLRVLGRGPGSGDVSSKVLTVAPASIGERRGFFTENGLNVSRLVAGIVGANTPSAQWTLRHGPTYDGVGSTEVINGGTTTDDEADGSSLIIFNSAIIPAQSFVWVEVTGVNGDVYELAVTIIPELAA